MLRHGLNPEDRRDRHDRAAEGNRRQRRFARFDDRTCRKCARRRAGAGACLAGPEEPGARRHRARDPSQCAGDPCRQCRGRRRSARRWCDFGLHRPPDADTGADRGDGRRRRHRARDCRSGRYRNRELAATQRHDHRTRARAARRDCRDLRKPSQCYRRRRRAVPEVRQRRDAARRLRQFPFLPRDP